MLTAILNIIAVFVLFDYRESVDHTSTILSLPFVILNAVSVRVNSYRMRIQAWSASLRAFLSCIHTQHDAHNSILTPSRLMPANDCRTFGRPQVVFLQRLAPMVMIYDLACRQILNLSAVDANTFLTKGGFVRRVRMSACFRRNITVANVNPESCWPLSISAAWATSARKDCGFT